VIATRLTTVMLLIQIPVHGDDRGQGGRPMDHHRALEELVRAHELTLFRIARRNFVVSLPAC